LSHNRKSTQTHGSALAVSIESPQADTPRAQLSLDSGVRSIAAMLSPRSSGNRCVLRFDLDQLLVCALDGASTDDLLAEARAIGNVRLLQAFRLTLTPVRTSLELQDQVRRMLDASAAGTPISGIGLRTS